MSEPSLPELEAERDRLFAQLSVVGDFRRRAAPPARTSPGRCCLRHVPWSRRPVRRSHVADAGGSVSEAMHAVSRRRI